MSLNSESQLSADISETTFTAFPNPTSSISHVNYKSQSDEDVTFSVSDITGALIHKETISNFKGEMNLDYNFESANVGTYIFTIQQGDKIQNRKVQLVK